MSKQVQPKVLIVDDEKTVRDFLLRLLRFEAIEAKAVEGCAQAIEAVSLEKFDIVFMDIRMPDVDGIRTYSELKQIDPGLSCVFMTGYALEQNLLDKIKDPSVICLKKPFQDISEIKNIVRDILASRKAKMGTSQDSLGQRAYSRLDVSLTVKYKIKDRDGLFSCFSTQDISAGGMQMVVPEQLPEGTLLELIICGSENEDICTAVAQVIRCEKSDTPAESYLVGVKFKEINLAELTALLLKIGRI